LAARTALERKDLLVPHNDYSDPELTFPRLEARVQKVEADAYWIQIWLWKEPGENRIEILNRKRAGSYEDAKQIILEAGAQYGVMVGPDDIVVE
jgi:hypothetical protein